MNLGFMTKFTKGKTLKGKPTNFVAQIKSGKKKHTIREDKTNRWGAGVKTHCFTGLRTRNCKRFHEGVCVSTQNIYFHKVYYKLIVLVDGRTLTDKEVEKLARNDGFNNAQEMFEWFDNTFVGKIIHFTKLRY